MGDLETQLNLIMLWLFSSLRKESFGRKVGKQWRKNMNIFKKQPIACKHRGMGKDVEIIELNGKKYFKAVCFTCGGVFFFADIESLFDNIILIDKVNLFKD